MSTTDPGDGLRISIRASRFRWPRCFAPPARGPRAVLRRTALMVVGLWLPLAACGGGGSSDGPLAPYGPSLPSGALVHFAFVGDTTTARVPTATTTDPLAEAAHLLESVDAFVFNHEGVLGPDATPPAGCAAWPQQSLFHAPTASARFLRRGAATIATLANNHILDCGAVGVDWTRDALTSFDIASQGAGPDAASACVAQRFEVRGTFVSLLAYLDMDRPEMGAAVSRAGAATWTSCDGALHVAEAKARGDIVVVCLHLHRGPGWTTTLWPLHRDAIEAAWDAGADVVVAHGPHVPQAVLARHGQIAFASLGNFLFGLGADISEPATRSVVADVRVHADRIDVALVPFRLGSDGKPHLPTASDAGQMLQSLRHLSLSEGTPLILDGHVAYLTVPR